MTSDIDLDSLPDVADRGVLQQGPEHHEEADGQVDVEGLHVGDLGEGAVDGAHEGDHGEDGGDAQAGPGGGRGAVQVETDPGHDHYQTGGDVHLAVGQSY